MYIREITIDGFKSYAARVVIPGFDPRFNAITGLNGSGKSNILDAICFVLGITNLSHVRKRGGEGEREGRGGGACLAFQSCRVGWSPPPLTPSPPCPPPPPLF